MKCHRNGYHLIIGVLYKSTSSDYYLLRNIWEYISYFIQPFLLLIVLYYSCYGTHPVTNAFEKIPVTWPISEGHPIDITLVVHLTTDHL